MAYDPALVERIQTLLADRAGVSQKRMFGGVCFLLHGHMACGVADDRLMLRVGPERHEATLALPHVVPMDFTGRPLRGFVFVQPAGFRTAAALRKWLDLALEVAATSPAEKGRPKLAGKARRTPKPLPPRLEALAERAKKGERA